MQLVGARSAVLGDRETAKEAEYVGMGGRLARAVRRASYKVFQESAVSSPESFGLKSVDRLHPYRLKLVCS